jgi:precorrin-3B methylase|tara:strand:- start:382 stop:591 length:210 start_codon:yes stop_codon:yes gene_type:complete
MMIKVEGHPHLFRDEKTGAIINCDDVGYDQYVKSVELRKNQRREISDMRKDIDEIKALLKIIVDGNNKT